MAGKGGGRILGLHKAELDAGTTTGRIHGAGVVCHLCNPVQKQVDSL